MESLNDRLPMAADAFEPLDNADSIEQAIVSLDPSVEIKKNDAESATCFDIPEYSRSEDFAWDFADPDSSPYVVSSADLDMVWREPFDNATVVLLQRDAAIDVSLHASGALVLQLPSELVRSANDRLGKELVVDTVFDISSFHCVSKDLKQSDLSLGDGLNLVTLEALSNGKWKVHLVPTSSATNDAPPEDEPQDLPSTRIRADFEISIQPLDDGTSDIGIGLTTLHVLRTSIRSKEGGGIAVETILFPLVPASPGGTPIPGMDGDSRPEGPNSGDSTPENIPSDPGRVPAGNPVAGDPKQGGELSIPSPPNVKPIQILDPVPSGSTAKPAPNPKTQDPSSTHPPVFRSIALPFSSESKSFESVKRKGMVTVNQPFTTIPSNNENRIPDFRADLPNLRKGIEMDLSKRGKVRAVGTQLQTTPFLLATNTLLATNAEPDAKDPLFRKPHVLRRPITDDSHSILVSRTENLDLTPKFDSQPDQEILDPNAPSYHLPIHTTPELSIPATTRNDSEKVPTAKASPPQSLEHLSWSTTVATGVSAIGMIQLTIEGEKAKNSLNAVTNQGSFVLFS
jgi:hypothetical protein